MWTVYEISCFLFHVQGTSSCDHAATSSAVLYRISDRRRGGASASVHRQSVLPRCEQRQVPTVALFFGLGFGSTLTRSSMCLGTRLLDGGS